MNGVWFYIFISSDSGINMNEKFKKSLMLFSMKAFKKSV